MTSTPRTDIESVKRSRSLVDVAAAFGVEWLTRGSRLVARCPFHADSDPSFTLSANEGGEERFKCFGCGESGDVITFVQKAGGYDFREAMRYLRDERGPAPGAPERPPAPLPRPRAARRELSIEDHLMLAAAAECYAATLAGHAAARRYLIEERGLPEHVLRSCLLGYAEGNELVPYLKRRRLSLPRARELGLLYRSGDESMGGRIVIPELRPGRVTWLTGRVFEERWPEAHRYHSLSLPKPLLGLERLRGQRRIFLTEGPFDYLTLVSWGLPAAALLGSEPGHQVMQLLQGLRAERIVLVLDADDAGRDAQERLAAALGDRAQPLTLPEGAKDVNELATVEGGREAFFAALDGARPARRPEASSAAPEAPDASA